MKSVAYMMDTNAWNANYANNTKASYAIGGPTMEMLFASYNKMHDVAFESQASSERGYKIRKTASDSWTTYISGMLDTSDTLYVKSSDASKSKASAYWLASPSADHTYSVRGVSCDGNVGSGYYYIASFGFRPVVCLNSNVKLQASGEGYELVL